MGTIEEQMRKLSERYALKRYDGYMFLLISLFSKFIDGVKIPGSLDSPQQGILPDRHLLYNSSIKLYWNSCGRSHSEDRPTKA
jgi:hypothetical protein